MIWPQLAIPTTSAAYYHRSEIQEILDCIQEGVYCAVLGPRLCGKTEIMRHVEQVLDEAFGWKCIFLDLMELRSYNQHSFFAELMRAVGQRLSQWSNDFSYVEDDALVSSAAFRHLLVDGVISLGENLVLIVEHLETIPLDLAQALLTSLRAAYMDQQTQDWQVTVVVSGALSMASLTVGESSPFRGIARRVFIKDLSGQDSVYLIEESLKNDNVCLTDQATRILLNAACGDPYLVRRLCQICAEQARDRLSRLPSTSVTRIIHEFLRDEVFQYAPLLEAARLIEENPELLRCIILLLERDAIPKSELPLPLSPDLDPLYLTGVVELDDDNRYRLQNLIYRRFLTQHFVPGRVGHILAMTGHWDQAIDHLENAAESGDARSRTDLLPAVINSIYASQDLRQAGHFLMRGLAAVFGVQDAAFWYALPQENRLQMIWQTGNALNGQTSAGSEMPVTADSLEARAFRQGSTLRGLERDGYVVRAIPLAIPGQKPAGVVTVWEDISGELFIDQRERDLQLTGFLRQAARAIRTVGLRRQELILAGRLQASMLPDSEPKYAGWGFSAAWRPARETAGDFYDFIPLPGDRLGLVIADVADKGMGAALYMALSRTLIRAFTAEHPDDPARVLESVNSRMLADADTGHFVTVFFAVLDIPTGRLRYCNAGHNPPYLFDTKSYLRPLALRTTGPALGVMGKATWSNVQLQIKPGMLLLIYTDGLVDALDRDKHRFGEERILETCSRLMNRSAPDVQEALMSEVRAFSADEPQFDDITLLVVTRDA
jgi:hypothetical protein